MSGKDVGFRADDVVAAGAGELSVDARLGPQVPDLDGAVVAGAHDLVVVTHELGRQDFAGMAGERVPQSLVVHGPNSAEKKPPNFHSKVKRTVQQKQQLPKSFRQRNTISVHILDKF